MSMLDKHAPSDSAPHAAPRSQPPTREGWGGCVAIVLSVVGVIGCVALALGMIFYRQYPRQLDQYLSLAPGQTSLYRVTYANGTEGFLSANTVQPDQDSLAYVTLRGQGGQAVQVHTIATNWQGQVGQRYTREDYYVRDGDTLLLLAQRTGGSPVQFTPPLLAWNAALLDTDAAQPLTGQVTFDGTSLDYKLWLDGREEVHLPDGRDVETLRLGVEYFDAGTRIYRTLSWYAAGVGLVRGEEFDGNGTLRSRAELLTSTRTASTSLPLDELLAEAVTSAHFFREDAARTGAHPEGSLSDGPLRVAYHLTLEANFTASPTVADDLLFVADQNGTLFALDAKQAMPQWRFGLGGSVVAAPAVANGLVYVGGSDKTLYALTAREGLFVWAFQLQDNVATSVVVSEGILFVCGEDRTLYALDALTGVERWRFEAGDRIVSSPAVAEGRVFFGSDEGLVYALDAATGEEHWHAGLDEAIFAAPAVAGGVVYVGSSQAQFAALDAATGEVLWRFESVFGYKASPAIGPEQVFIASDDGVLRSLRRADGEEIWTWRTANRSTLVSSPLLIGDQLVIVDGDGTLYLLDQETGSVQSQLSLTPAGVTGSPTWDGETLYLTTQDRQVLAVRAGAEVFSPSLRVAWDFSFGGVENVLYAAPVLVQEMLYAVDHTGVLWQLDPVSGQGVPIAQWHQTIEAAPAIEGTRLFVGTQTENIFAFDLAQRAVVWQTPLAGGVRFAPLGVAGHIYVHASTETGGVVYALEAGSGQVEWQYETQGFANSSPALENGVLVVSGDGLIGLNPDTGVEIWRTSGFTSYGGTLAGGGTVYAAGAGPQNETLIALDPTTGEIRWQSFESGIFIFSRPALDEDSRTLVAGSSEGVIYGVDADTGTTRWRFLADSGIQSDVQIQCGLVYFSSVNGILYVLESRTGNLLANANLGSVFSHAAPLVTPEWVYATIGATLYAMELTP